MPSRIKAISEQRTDTRDTLSINRLRLESIKNNLTQTMTTKSKNRPIPIKSPRSFLNKFHYFCYKHKICIGLCGYQSFLKKEEIHVRNVSLYITHCYGIKTRDAVALRLGNPIVLSKKMTEKAFELAAELSPVILLDEIRPLIDLKNKLEADLEIYGHFFKKIDINNFHQYKKLVSENIKLGDLLHQFENDIIDKNKLTQEINTTLSVSLTATLSLHEHIANLIFKEPCKIDAKTYIPTRILRSLHLKIISELSERNDLIDAEIINQKIAEFNLKVENTEQSNNQASEFAEQIIKIITSSIYEVKSKQNCSLLELCQGFESFFSVTLKDGIPAFIANRSLFFGDLSWFLIQLNNSIDSVANTELKNTLISKLKSSFSSQLSFENNHIDLIDIDNKKSNERRCFFESLILIKQEIEFLANKKSIIDKLYQIITNENKRMDNTVDNKFHPLLQFPKYITQQAQSIIFSSADIKKIIYVNEKVNRLIQAKDTEAMLLILKGIIKDNILKKEDINTHIYPLMVNISK